MSVVLKIKFFEKPRSMCKLTHNSLKESERTHLCRGRGGHVVLSPIEPPNKKLVLARAIKMRAGERDTGNENARVRE